MYVISNTNRCSDGLQVDIEAKEQVGLIRKSKKIELNDDLTYMQSTWWNEDPLTYFSTERPQPLRMTTVDLIFLWYYVLTGVTIVATSVSSLLSEKIFIAAMTGLKIAVPIGVIGIVAFLIRRIKSNRLKPRIN